MNLPNFLIIGVQKCRTTSNYNYLKQHPQVYMSPVKETNFLEREWENIAPDKKKPQKIDTFEKYCQLFAGVKDEIAIGEASPNYLFHYQTSSELILRYVPDVKMIAILRDPAERAYSDYMMNVREARVKRSLTEQIKYSSHKSFVILKGFYYTAIKHYMDKFGEQRVKVYLYDDLCQDAVRMMQDMYGFIGVESDFLPDTSIKSQTAAIPKIRLWNNLLKQKNLVRSTISSLIKPVLPLSARQKIRSKLINMNLQKDKSKFPFSTEDRRNLVNLYREDILKLQDLIQRDLSQWLKY